MNTRLKRGYTVSLLLLFPSQTSSPTKARKHHLEQNVKKKATSQYGTEEKTTFFGSQAEQPIVCTGSSHSVSDDSADHGTGLLSTGEL